MKKNRDVRIRIAALPYRQHKHRGLELCIVTSRKHGYWILPTGKPEKKLSPADVAQLEAYEEAGVLGKTANRAAFELRTCSGKKARKRRVTFYPLKVRKTLKHWPEKKQRQRRWVSVQRLKKALKDPHIAEQVRQQLSGSKH